MSARMTTDPAATQKHWEDAVIRAAAEASRLQPLAAFLAIASAALIFGSLIAEPLIDLVNSDGMIPWSSTATRALENLIELLPAIPLLAALWGTQAYLGKLARGDVWGPATMGMLGRVGEALLWAAGLSILAAPTLSDWIHGHFGFSFNLEARDLALAGLGLLLSLIARVVRNVVEVAAALKRENDAII
jgi:hypothetical protein